ncbi:MAG: VOC family protein [Burkholderiales bacterium]
MIRYKKLGYIALNVSDVERSRAWYRSMVGLEPNGYGPAGEAFMRADRDHHSLVLYQGAKPGLKRIGWQLEDDRQLDVVARVLDQHGLRWRSLGAEECAAIGMTHTIRLAEPVTGITLDFYGSGMTQMPEPVTSPVCDLDFLCHIGIGTPRYREAIKFYEEVLNFKTSDEIDGRINLMRAFPNPMHHSFAIANADRDKLHHYNFMVRSVADIDRGRERFRAGGVPIVWDGHHPPSGNTFLFFLDRDGLSVEYGVGMEMFPEVGARPHRVFPARPESFDSKGAVPERRMAAAGDIEVVEEI